MAGGTKYLDEVRSVLGTALAIRAGNTSVWEVNGDDVGTLTLTIDAVNNGAGGARVILTADNDLQLGDAVRNPLLTLAGSGDITISSARQMVLIDNNAAALQIGSSGKLDLLVLDTTNLSETMTVSGHLRTTQGVTGGTALEVGGRAADAAAGSVVTATIVETATVRQVLPAATITQGKTLQVQFGVRVTAAAAGNITVRMRLGVSPDGPPPTGQVLLQTNTVALVNGNVITGVFELTSDGPPGSGPGPNVSGCGYFSQPAAAGGAMVTAYLVPTAMATDGALDLTLTIELSDANVGNSVTADYFRLLYV